MHKALQWSFLSQLLLYICRFFSLFKNVWLHFPFCMEYFMILLKLCFNVSQVYELISFGDFMIFLWIINCFCSLTDWPVSLIKTKVHKKIYRILLRLSVQQKINLLWRVFVEIVKTGIYIFNPWRIHLKGFSFRTKYKSLGKVLT